MIFMPWIIPRFLTTDKERKNRRRFIWMSIVGKSKEGRIQQDIIAEKRIRILFNLGDILEYILIIYVVINFLLTF
jgi:hypothetical protein